MVRISYDPPIGIEAEVIGGMVKAFDRSYGSSVVCTIPLYKLSKLIDALAAIEKAEFYAVHKQA